MTSYLKNNIRRAQPLLGTFVEITAYGSNTAFLHAAVDQGFALVKFIHCLMSYYEEESDISRINRYAYEKAIAIHPFTYRVLEEAQRLSCISHGAFDVTVASTLEKWGLLPTTDLLPLSEETLSFRNLQLLPDSRVRFSNPHLRIDLGGIAKGFAIDCVVSLLKYLGVVSGCVNAGGDLRVFGEECFPVAIRNPQAPSTQLLAFSLQESALCNSGTYFHRINDCGRVFHHLVNPFNHLPCLGFSAAGVFASSALVADALTKVLMVRGSQAQNLFCLLNAKGYLVDEKKPGHEVVWVGLPS